MLPLDWPPLDDDMTTAVTGNGRRGELLERSRHLAALAALLDAVREHSEGRLVLVGGEAGVGKTSLLRRFCDDQPRVGAGPVGAAATRC